MIHFDYIAKSNLTFIIRRPDGSTRSTQTLIIGDCISIIEDSGSTFEVIEATRDEIRAEMVMRQYRAEHHGAHEMKRV